MHQEHDAGGAGLISWGDICYLVCRYKAWWLGGLLLGLAGAAAVFFLSPPVYRAEAKLLVRYISDTTFLDPGAAGGRVLSPDARGENIINSEVEILANRDLVERVVDQIGPDKFPLGSSNGTERAIAVLHVLRNLHVEVPKRSNIIKVYYDGPAPALSLQVLSGMVNAYLEKHLQIHRSAAAYEFLTQQTDQMRAKLVETEEELRQLKNKAGIVTLQDAKSALVARMTELRKAQGDAEAELAGVRARLKVMEPVYEAHESDRLAMLQDTNATSRQAVFFERLNQLQQRRLLLLATYTEDSIPVQSIQALIRQTQLELEQAAGGGLGSNTNHLPRLMLPETSSIAQLEARIGVIKAQMNTALDEVRQLDEIEARIVQLERNKQIQEDHYRNFSRSLEQARIDDALDSGKISNISVVQSPSLSAMKYRPGLLPHLALALGLGLGLGVLGLVLRDNIPGRTVRSRAEVEKSLRLPLLLSVPLLGSNGHARRRAAGEPAAAPAAGPPVRAELGEYCEALRDRVVLALGDTGPAPGIIGLAGCRAGAGVSTLATGLALALARHDEQRVLLINADPRPAPGGRFLGVNPSGGMTDILADPQGHASLTERSFFLASPPGGTPNMSTLLVRGWDDMGRLAQEQGYRFVVLDLPPATPTSSTLRLASRLHALVLVVEAERDQRYTVQRVRDLLVQSRVKLAGVVLNKTRARVPAWLHPGL